MTSRVDVLLDTVRAGRDPFAVFPLRWEEFVSHEGEGMFVGGDGHEVDLDARLAVLFCQLANLAAAERYGTAVPPAAERC